MRRRAVLLAVLLAGLVSCAPRTADQGEQPRELSEIERRSLADPAELRMGSGANGQQAVLFAAGPNDPATLGRWVITGTRLRLNDERCTVPDRSSPYTVVCDFTGVVVPASKQAKGAALCDAPQVCFRLPISGRRVEVDAGYSRGESLFVKTLVPDGPTIGSQ